MKAVFTILIAVILAGCAVNPPPQSYLPSWTYLNVVGCTLGNNGSCSGQVSFFGGGFTASMFYCQGPYNFNVPCGNSQYCTISGSWTDLNPGAQLGQVQLVINVDSCADGITPGTQETDSYNALTAQIQGTF
jgi:hypothetical protein